VGDLVTVLLAVDAVELFGPTGSADAHGWAEPGTDPAWTGVGNLQVSAFPSDPRAADAGGHGPFDPATRPTGSLFLPVDASPAEGQVALVRGQSWALSQVRLVVDPSGGGVDCWVATATASDWPTAQELPHG
jgi:hypothetical protein